MQKEKLVKDYNSLEEELVFYINDIKKYDKLMDEVSSWQDKVKKIDTLLGEHIYWTKFFEKLEENILPEVKFTGFAGTIGSSLSLEAAAPDYKTVAKQWIILEDADDFAESVDIGGISMRSGQDNIYVSFSLLLNLVEDNFYRK